MLQISGQNLISNYSKNTASFGRAKKANVTSDDRSQEEYKAAKVEELARKLAESEKVPSAARSFAIVTALMTASALTGAAVSGRFFNVLNQIGALKKITPAVSKGIQSLSQKLENTPAPEGIRGQAVKGLKSLVTSMQNASVYGVEEKLSKLNAKRARKISSIKKMLIKRDPALAEDKEALKKALDDAIETNPSYKEFFSKLDNEIHDLKGSNISRKATKATAATVMGYGALKEASRDEDENGVPDCVEYSKAKREATQKVTAAIIDCALDTI